MVLYVISMRFHMKIYHFPPAVLLAGLVAAVFYISCDPGMSRENRLPVPTGKDAKIIYIDGNTEKIEQGLDGTLVW